MTKTTEIDITSYEPIISEIFSEMGKVIIGQKNLLEKMMIALFSGGHILLEGAPGLAKTKSISTLSKTLGVSFQRIQFTPDLLPSDLIGTQMYHPKDHSFTVKKGPIFAHFILSDEINRAPAKVQSALLEAMQEGQVTIGEETFSLPHPFFVLATQNPIEQEGTYPLPEAQVDRFLMKVVLDYPSRDEELDIMKINEVSESVHIKKILTGKKIEEIQKVQQKIYADDTIKHYIRDIVFASRFPEDYGLTELKNIIAYGCSPRASLALLHCAKGMALLRGRNYVIPEDVKAVGKDVLRHRIIPTFEAEAEDITTDTIVENIFDAVQVP